MDIFDNQSTTPTANFDVVIPIYKNEESISELLKSLDTVASEINGDLRVLFVDDGSPDNSAKIILDSCESFGFKFVLIRHSRNFGSFSAIRTGLKYSTAEYVGVISADLQESPSLLLTFFSELQNGQLDIVFGTRLNRSDPKFSKFMSTAYWKIYRKFINKDIPVGGVDVFACTNQVTNEINKLGEARTSLIGMLFWVGYRRGFIGYVRQPRKFGNSSWTFRNKFKYMADSVFSFSDLPIRIIRFLGIVGVLLALILSSVLFVLAAQDAIKVPGYAPLMLVVLFGSSANLVALSILGSYIWRSFELAQSRPIAIVRRDRIVT